MCVRAFVRACVVAAFGPGRCFGPLAPPPSWIRPRTGDEAPTTSPNLVPPPARDVPRVHGQRAAAHKGAGLQHDTAHGSPGERARNHTITHTHPCERGLPPGATPHQHLRQQHLPAPATPATPASEACRVVLCLARSASPFLTCECAALPPCCPRSTPITRGGGGGGGGAGRVAAVPQGHPGG